MDLHYGRLEEEMTNKTNSKVVGKQVRISRKNPDNVRTVFANDLVVTHTKNEFFLTFSEIELPPILEKKAFQELQEIEAIARVKMVVTLEFAKAIVKTFSSNIDTFESESS